MRKLIKIYKPIQITVLLTIIRNAVYRKLFGKKIAELSRFSKTKKPLMLLRGFSMNLNFNVFFGRKRIQVVFLGFVGYFILDIGYVKNRFRSDTNKEGNCPIFIGNLRYHFFSRTWVNISLVFYTNSNSVNHICYLHKVCY